MNKGVIIGMVAITFVGMIGALAFAVVQSSPKNTETVQQTPIQNQVLTAQTQTSLDADKLWNLIQNFRTQNGIPTITRDDRLCDYANKKVQSLKIIWEDEISLDRKLFRDGEVSANYSRDIKDEQTVFDTWLKAERTKQNMSVPYKYGCAVTDGYYSLFLIANLNTAGVGVTPTVAPDQDVMCTIDQACGGGYKKVTKRQCDNMICCVLGDRSYLYDDKAKCQQDISQVEKNTSVYDCQQKAQKEYENRKGECDTKKDDQATYNSCLQAIYDDSNTKYKACSTK